MYGEEGGDGVVPAGGELRGRSVHVLGVCEPIALQTLDLYSTPLNILQDSTHTSVHHSSRLTHLVGKLPSIRRVASPTRRVCVCIYILYSFTFTFLFLDINC